MTRIPPTAIADAISSSIDNALAEIKANPPRNAWKDLQGFNLVSLGDWLALCEQTGVPTVSATRIGAAPVEALLAFDSLPDNPDLRRLADALSASRKPDTLYRWDMCSPVEVKHNLAKGNAAWQPLYSQPPMIDDPRAYDLIYEYPGHDITVWQRPWMTFAERDGYPVEYRAFVHHGRLTGVSSYYPQRPLPPDPDVLADLEQAARWSAALAAALEPPLRYPGGAAKAWSADSISFTADFARLPSGELLYLEGGPPYGAGAHPCCFPPDPADWNTHPDFRLDGEVPVQLKPHPKAVLRPE